MPLQVVVWQRCWTENYNFCGTAIFCFDGFRVMLQNEMNYARGNYVTLPEFQ